MQVDWLTVAAQIVNFLVLVWLLKRTLYRPILDAMSGREARINARLADAQAARDAAEAEAARLRDMQEALEAARERTLDAAREEARLLGQRLEASLRDDIADKRNAWRRRLADEREDLRRSLRREAGREALAVARRLVADYAGGDLTRAAADSFVERLRDLDDETRAKLAAAAEAGDGAAIVETATPLPPADRAQVTRALHRGLGSELAVRYAEDEALVLGLRVTVGAFSLEWSGARHLRRLEAALDEILELEADAQAGGSGRPEGAP